MMDRKQSSILGSSFEPSSLIIKTPLEEMNLDMNNYYTLIDRVAFVKKSQDSLKVTFPNKKSEINCPPQFMLSTLYITEGVPLDSTVEVGPQKIIQSDNSPLNITLKL